jgi:hypothetical protein
MRQKANYWPELSEDQDTRLDFLQHMSAHITKLKEMIRTMDFTKNFKEFLLEHNTQYPAVAIAWSLFMVATEQERRPVRYERV